MNNVTQAVQRIRQAPWRQQRQWVSTFLVGLVMVAMVSGIYLNITVRATLTGRRIQMIQSDIADKRLVISDSETKLASLTSVTSMQQRAEALGFHPASPDEITYVVVPGYAPKTAINMSINGANTQKKPVILPEYTESLFDWLTRKLTSSVPVQGQP